MRQVGRLLKVMFYDSR